MAASNAGIGVYVDTKAFKLLSADFKKTAPEAYKATQVALRLILKRTLSTAANNAGYSARIQMSGKTRMNGLNGKVQFGGAAAPEAAPIENEGKGFVRHPVFGHMDVWTSKNSHGPFLAPAFNATKEEALKILDDAVFGAVGL